MMEDSQGAHAAGPRLLIVDQSLRDEQGHHCEYDLAVVGAAWGLGLRVEVAAHADFPLGMVDDAPVVGRFGATWRDSQRSPVTRAGRALLRRMPSNARAATLELISQRLARRPQQRTVNTRFAGDLLRLLAAQRYKQRDHVLIHTISEAECLGLMRAAEGRSDLPAIHVVLRYESTAEMEKSWHALANTNRICHFWCDTDELAAHYEQLGVHIGGVLPIPHLSSDSLARPRETITPLTLAYLGDARSEKGYQLLPDLADAIAADYLASGQVHLLIQVNYGLSREEPAMARATRRLEAMPRNWVTLLPGVLGVQDFHRALRSSDIVLLPYRAECYKKRSSGILVQAAAAGIPAVVPMDTWLEREGPSGAFVAFGPTRPLAEATRAAIHNYHALKASAVLAAPRIRERHSATRLVRLIMRDHS